MKGINIVFNILLVSLVLFLAACGNGGSGETGQSSGAVNVRPGTLGITQMDGMSKPVFKNLTSSSSSTFDLGTIKASRDFYFMLNNSGDLPVTNIVITSLNSNFTVSPNNIDSIRPHNDNYVTPIIRVSAVHGITLDGTGYTSTLLPMGNNLCTLRITGKTKDYNNDIDIAVTVNMKVFAEVMDVSIVDNTADINLFNPDAYASYKFGGEVPSYKTMNTPIIKNTGNVDITVTNYENFVNGIEQFPILDQFILHPNEFRTLSYPINSTNSSSFRDVTLIIVSNNTISNYNKLRLKPDGTVCIRLVDH